MHAPSSYELEIATDAALTRAAANVATVGHQRRRGPARLPSGSRGTSPVTPTHNAVPFVVASPNSADLLPLLPTGIPLPADSDHDVANIGAESEFVVEQPCQAMLADLEAEIRARATPEAARLAAGMSVLECKGIVDAYIHLFIDHIGYGRIFSLNICPLTVFHRH